MTPSQQGAPGGLNLRRPAGSRVLVVDDREDDRELLTTLLKHSGHCVVALADGEEALRTAKQGRFCVAIVDLMMPGMDGWEFIRRLRQDAVTANVPVILHSATFGEEARELAHACGATRFLQKGSEPNAMLRAVQEAVETGPAARAHPPVDIDRLRSQVLGGKLLETLRQVEALSGEREVLLSTIEAVRQEERQRLACELHDDTLQVMAAVGMRLELLAGAADAAQSETVRRLHETLKEATVRLRGLTFELRPGVLDQLGLAGAVRMYMDEQELTGEQALRNDLRDEPTGAARIVLYRVIVEALINARKHSAARHIHVALCSRRGGWEATVSDDGLGFDTAAVRPGHFGLSIMRERAHALGGSLAVESAPGRGSRVTVWLPADPPANPPGI